ncbi:pyridoxal-dependent decarboxylase [Oligoflexus tunisiensis]|uniref:pyridoxal-dependent decarboxylase n=1 Tax=Oligoflexus tunisiensis TaxID=708132 RepID=UPI000B19FC4E|nr:pyridoxal-dependent decarboxylase [Oligoflexus tunisiensis]
MNENNSPFPLDPERLTQAIQQLLPVIAQHLGQLPQQPVKPGIKPGDVARNFAAAAPPTARSLDELLKEFQDLILPAITHWQHPRFFAYYPATTSLPAVLSELLIAALGSVGLQWSANPAATELECVVMDWIMRLLHAPEDSPFLHLSRQGGGLIQNTAGEALAVVMVAARVQQHRREGAGREQDPEDIYWQDSSSLVAYMSDQTHFSGPKAVRVAGMRLHKIPARRLAHGNMGISAEDARQTMAADRAQGLTPCAVLLNYGSTNTSGYDELASFVGMREQEKVWVHVDAAYAGASLILPEYRERARLIQDIATSFNFNGSKWFLCGFDSAFLFIRDRQLLRTVYAAGGEYLAQTGDESIYNPEFKDWSIPLGRRFRSLRIWMVLSYYGVEGLQAYLRGSIAQADWFREKIDASAAFQQIVRTEWGLVCFQLKSTDPGKNELFLQRLEERSEQGRNFLFYPSQLNGQHFVRLALGSVHTTQEDLEMFWAICLEASQGLHD